MNLPVDKVQLAMLNAAKDAGDTILQMLEGSITCSTKRDARDIVTEADIVSEKIIVNALQKLPGSFGFLGEEGAKQSGTDGTFYIDPIDGTICYVNGMYFGVSIGLVKDGSPIVGVIYYPRDNTTLTAVKQPYQRGPRLLTPAKPAHELLVGFDFGSGVNRKDVSRQYLEPLLSDVRYVLTFACTTWACRLICEGKLDAYVHPGATAFDWAAASLIVQNHGGVCRDFNGNPLNFGLDTIPGIMARDEQTFETVQQLYNNH